MTLVPKNLENRIMQHPGYGNWGSDFLGEHGAWDQKFSSVFQIIRCATYSIGPCLWRGVFSVSFWNFRHLSAQQVVGTGALVPEVVVLEHWRRISFQKRRNKRITEYVDNQHHIRRLCLDTIDLGNHYASCNIYSKTITDLGS